MLKSGRMSSLVLAFALSGGAWAGSVADPCESAVCPDDAQINAEVRRQIRQQPALKFHNIGVRTVKGVVYLQGIVDTRSERRSARLVAESVPGVRKVYDDLTVDNNGG